MEALPILLCVLLIAKCFQATTIGSWPTDSYATLDPSAEPCGGNMTDWMGEFFSPGYPNYYPNKARCTWNIHSTGQTTVLLTFSYVDLETCCDYIRVFDGPTSSYPLLGEVRENRRQYFNSTQNDLTVAFYSDGSVTQKGFRADWVFVDSNSCEYYCGFRFNTCSCDSSCKFIKNCCHDYNHYCVRTTDLPYLETSTAPTPYSGSCWNNCGASAGNCWCDYGCKHAGDCCPDYENYCQWTTESPDPTIDDVIHSCEYSCGYDFGICSCESSCQYRGNCCYDFHWYCPDTTTSWPITTNNHPACGGHLYGSGLFSSPNYPYYYYDNAHCVWYLSAQPGQRIFLSFADVQLERCCTCDYISVHDGSSTSNRELGRICFNDTTHQSFHSSSRYMTIVFRSDYSGVSHGFKALFTSSLTADQGRVDCSSDNMVIVIQNSYLNSLGFSGNDLYVDDHRCRPTITSYEVVFRFPLNTCGTSKEMMNGYVTYSNNIRASPSQSGEITRQSQFLLHVGCRMESDTMVEIFYRAKEITHANITGTGRFNASIAFFTSSSFYQQIYDSPYEVGLNQFMYVQVWLDRPDNSLDLFLDTCVASPDPDDFKTRSYDLLRNGCVKDNTFYSYINGQQYYARFHFKAFKFLRTHAKVYLQCNVIICPDNDYNSRCRQGCRSRRKRSLESNHHSNTVILGPIKLRGGRPDVKKPEKAKE